MFTTFTFQDWAAAQDKERLLLDVIAAYKQSHGFLSALEAKDYFASHNRAIGGKTVLRAVTYAARDKDGRPRRQVRHEAVPGARIPSGFFYRFVVQENQFLLGGGVTLDDPATKRRLGPGFDTLLQRCGENALVAGVCWGFWNCDRLEVIEAARDPLSGFVALADEQSGQPMLGIQFWQIDHRRPLYVRLFELDGVTVLRRDNDRLNPVQEKRPYRVTVAADGAGERVETGNYPCLPVVPLWANEGHRSELTPALKQKIDAYDRILSDFGDNLEQANDVYWVLNNFGGSVDDIAEMLEQIRRLRVIANISDGSGAGSTAQPHAFQVPHEARRVALGLLRRELYADAMALDMDELSGGSLTNVAIQAAFSNLNLKCDRFEWQVFAFVQQILRLAGVETEKISFVRRSVVNQSEIVADIAAMRGDIDRQTALELNPYLEQDRVPTILKRLGGDHADR